MRRAKVAALLRSRSRNFEDKNDQVQALRENYLEVFVNFSS
jgi:hypothetical protein